MNKKQKNILHRARRRRNCRTFVGYIGLVDGRPHVYESERLGVRVVALYLNERKAKREYADTSMVTVTGVWDQLPRRKKR